MSCRGRPLADLAGRVAVVSGASRGIGRAAAERLAGLGSTVVLLVRGAEDGEHVAAGIRSRGGRADVVTADLAVQAAVRSAGAEILRRHSRLHLLIHNAAIVPRDREVTPDGIERQLAVNHLAPFLLTHLLLDALKVGTPARVVTVSSGAHAGARLDFDDLMSERQYRPGRAYARTKLANILFTRELARRLEGTGVTANCLHPGVIATRLLADYMGVPFGATGARIFGGTPERGAEPIAYLAASPEVAGVSGRYFDKCETARPSAAARDDEVARRLWEESERLTGLA